MGGAWPSRLRRWSRRDDADSAPVLDLTDVDEVTTMLLAPPAEYQGLRRRVVDQFTIVSANRCQLARSVNWGPLDGLLNSIVPGTGRLDTAGRLPPEVCLLLPISTLPKRALVGFDLVGPGGSDAHLMPYGTSVAIQGNLVALLAEDAGCPLPGDARRVVDAISRFRPGRLTGNLPRLAPRRGRPLSLEDVRTYLEREADLAVPAATMRSWQGLLEPAQSLLGQVLDEPFDPLSSADTLLLAVGELWRDPEVPTPLEIDHISGYLGEFTAWIDRLSLVGAAATPVLSTVAEYGRRWEALAAVTVDPYRPCLIKMKEERRTVLARRFPVRDGAVPLRRRWLTPVALVDIDPGGPGSYHASVGTDDSSIELSTPVTVDLWDQRIDRTYIEDVHQNREVYAFYSIDASRAARAKLVVGLSVSPDVGRVAMAILVLMVLTVALSALPFRLGADAVAVVAVPSSFAATMLLTRERSSLAAWVLGPTKQALLALLVALAVLSGLRALGWHTPPEEPAPSIMSVESGESGART
ncbi:hypothetical protein UG55_1028104 [Frankia sp. EI5c]|uniref:hypothetical protein n=1 Tax=Frankia sp. EI5c TaxID=683316 RepID=UPI0007C28E06|nr:hypothetical protein [Frankia sp. EI5c]OAA22001.1 hypothetical protein UG55_10523 [Frankia sp. EI5c]OAA24772.1 hypothetical protein UG55_1028104 [Frankia sp. EI5c]